MNVRSILLAERPCTKGFIRFKVLLLYTMSQKSARSFESVQLMGTVDSELLSQTQSPFEKLASRFSPDGE